MELKEIGDYSKSLLRYKPSGRKKVISHKDTPLRILRIISQRPYLTGSGINLINLIKQTNEAGLDQFVIFGQPVGELNPLKDLIKAYKVLWTSFENEEMLAKPDVPFPIPGMSDQMPYKSTKFSDFTNEMLELYLEAFADRIKAAVEYFKPNLIHSHHLWLVTALCRVLNPEIPMIGTCHNTAFRQLLLANHLADYIIKPIQDLDVITVLNEDQRNFVLEKYFSKCRIPKANKIKLIGTSMNTDIFYPPLDKICNENLIKIIYVGKLSYSKGVPELITAFKQLIKNSDFNAELYLIGSGVGEEYEKIIELSKEAEQKIHFLGQLDQNELANRLRECDLFILPSYYEGYPRVVLEALGCGTRVIMTDIPGIKENIYKNCGENKNISFIPMPEMKSIDQPKEKAIPKYIENLKNEILKHMSFIKEGTYDSNYSNKVCEYFGWKGFFKKYLEIYSQF